MRIAQVSPLYESVPPELYGGTERIVSYLTEELVKQGHEVTLFASGDSTTSANLVACSPKALRLNPNCVDPLAHHYVMLEKVFEDISRFDIVHFHIDYLHFPLSKRLKAPNVTTLHGRLDMPDLVPLYKQYRKMPIVSISDSQRKPLPFANWRATVYHGIPEDLYSFREVPGDYLAFLGRISPEKGVDRAIEIAVRAGMRLRIAAKVDKVDRQYFEAVIKPRLDHPLVEFVGEIGEAEKDDLLGNAYALLFTIDWPEPFGLVMIEAMSCGTPVIAFGRGSVPEIMREGVGGFIVEDVAQAAKAVKRVADLDRKRCRLLFEERFTVGRMTGDYLAVYKQVVESSGEDWMAASMRSSAQAALGMTPT